MNILIIGNGFDLAHGLPTTYKDFLIFIKRLKQYFGENNKEIIWGSINQQIIEIPESKLYSQKEMWELLTNPQIEEMLESNIKNDLNFQKNKWEPLINNNFWIDYFLKWDVYDKETWIDFETEIGNVVKTIDKELEVKNINDKIEEKDFLEYFAKERENKKYINFNGNAKTDVILIYHVEDNLIKKPIMSYHQLIERLEDDLNKMIKALEIYLVEYVEKMQIDLVSKDFKDLRFDHILSFNYTNTYEKLYGELYTNENKKPEYDYIHGKANADNDIESNNMVLGIDEYLDNDKKNKNLEFISFKKYYQRIYKETGCKYKEWVDKIKECEYDTKSKLKEEFPTQIPYIRFANQHTLSIFGHSLDVTDRDILRDLILNDSVYTTIYYKDKKTMGKQISNLVKLIGQDELIKRTGGNTKTIEFRMQQDMIQK